MNLTIVCIHLPKQGSDPNKKVTGNPVTPIGFKKSKEKHTKSPSFWQTHTHISIQESQLNQSKSCKLLALLITPTCVLPMDGTQLILYGLLLLKFHSAFFVCSCSRTRQPSKVVSTHLWNTPLNLYQRAIKGFVS